MSLSPKIAWAPPPQIGFTHKTIEDLQNDHSGFSALSDVLKKLSGINLPLNPKNCCLMACRLAPILRTKNLDSYQRYLQYILSAGDQARQEFVSALTTNTTHFFREPRHFDLLKLKLPELLKIKEKNPNREIRIWCSASSTGQEAYTLAMTLLESIPNISNWNIKFLATDIDQDVLEKASNGIYNSNEVESIPPLYRQKYFQKVADGGDYYQVKPQLRRIIQFAPFNLLSEKYPFRYPFDIIFCRNVLIYFDLKSSQQVVNKLSAALSLSGYLFLGHSESGAMKSPLLSQIGPASYQKTNSSENRK